MIKHYLRIAIRNIYKNRIKSLINILGLSIGITFSISIFLHLYEELNYDRHYKQADNIYRLVLSGDLGGNHFEAAVCGAPMALYMQQDIGEIEAITRLIKLPGTALLTFEDKDIYEELLLYADSTFFQIFESGFISGDPATCLNEPNSIVLRKSVADKYFGSIDPTGKIIKLNNDNSLKVTAVIEDSQNKSHLNFNGLISLSTLNNHARLGRYLKTPFAFVTASYIRIRPDSDDGIVQQDVQDVVNKTMNIEEDAGTERFKIRMQPITEIHLHSDVLHELETNGDIQKVYIFSVIAFLIIILGLINFINLSTAMAYSRVLEVGIMKIHGAARKNLIFQFLTETLVVVVISLLLSLFFLELLSPVLHDLMGHDTDLKTKSLIIITVFGFVLLLSALSGIFPAVIISSFNPLKFIKGEQLRGHKSPFFRNLMVAIQFLITIVLVCGTMLVYKQLGFISHKDIGFKPEELMVITMRERSIYERYKMLSREIRSLPEIEDVALASSYPGRFERRRAFILEGYTEDNSWMILFTDASYNYLDVLKAEIKLGRNFSPTKGVDSLSVLINETLALEAGWDDPIGKTISTSDGTADNELITYRVIGVMKDFNVASLHETVKPLIIKIEPRNFRYLTIRINPESGLSDVIASIAQKWESLFPQNPFDYFMVETKLNDLYSQEKEDGKALLYFTILAIFIAVLGLFGLALHIAQLRLREIGIRKVLGASRFGAFTLLTISFIKPVIIAAILAVPAAWYIMDLWLDNFSYRVHISWGIFVLSILISVFISLLTVITIALNAAGKNPVDSIKYE